MISNIPHGRASTPVGIKPPGSGRDGKSKTKHRGGPGFSVFFSKHNRNPQTKSAQAIFEDLMRTFSPIINNKILYGQVLEGERASHMQRGCRCNTVATGEQAQVNNCLNDYTIGRE
jgi:hypothetical protein